MQPHASPALPRQPAARGRQRVCVSLSESFPPVADIKLPRWRRLTHRIPENLSSVLQAQHSTKSTSHFIRPSVPQLTGWVTTPHKLWGGSVVKDPPANAGDVGSIPGARRSPGEGNGNPLQYSCLGNPMGRGAWRVIVRGVTKSQTQLRKRLRARAQTPKGFKTRSVCPALGW